MSERIIGIDIGSHTLKVAVVEKSFRNREVRHLIAHEIVGLEKNEIASILKRAMESFDYDKEGDMVVSVFPGRLLSSRNVSVPLKKRRQILEILPYEIEPLTPFTIDSFVCAYTSIDIHKNGAKLLTAIALKPDLAEFLNIFNLAGIDPDVVIPSPMVSYMGVDDLFDVTADELCALANVGHSSIEITLLKNKKPIAFHSTHCDDSKTAKTLSIELNRMLMKLEQEDEVAILSTIAICGGQAESASLMEEIKACVSGSAKKVAPSVELPTTAPPSAFTGVLGAVYQVADAKKSESVNLRSGEFEKKQKLTGHKGQNIITALLFTILIMTIAVSSIMETAELEQKYKTLKSEIRTQFKTVLPNIKNIVSESQQIKNAMSRTLAKSDSIGLGLMEIDPLLDQLRDISKAVPDGVKLDVNEFLYEWEGIKLSGRTESYEKIEMFKKKIEELLWTKKVTMKKTRTTASSGEINFRFEIKSNR